MKKGKLFRRASFITLSAVMAAGVALAAAGCGGDGGEGAGLGQLGDATADTYMDGTPGDEYSQDPNTLSVYIFCNAADKQTNEDICKAWAKKYNDANGTNIKVNFRSKEEKDDYFKDISDAYQKKTVPDIVYLSPRYVRTYAEAGRVLNLGDYLTTVSADPSLPKDQIAADNAEKFADIWSNALSYYGYRRGNKLMYTMGQTIEYDANGEKGAGFYAEDGYKSGLYGLPKDYSNFSTGYNKVFFTQELKKKLTTVHADADRDVKGPKGDSASDFTSKLTYGYQAGQSGTYGNVITYAVTADYTNPYTEETMHAVEGQAAPIINIGVPTRYKPYNLYKFASFEEAYDGGDPVATLVQEFTDGKGYVVTIPGFPDETFEVPEEQRAEGAPYDTSMGHIVYTYAEYSALLWSMSFFLNTFAWDGGQADIYHGNGGRFIKNDSTNPYQIVYAGEQYDGADGTPLYLLPWLFSNDADVINVNSNVCADTSIASDVAITNASDWTTVASKQSNKVKKLNLDGTYREVDVQYGYNSERFIETFGAFQALGCDWSGNTAGDTLTRTTANGWSFFRAGKCIFYGAGSWDSATRNEADPDMFQFGQCPAPVAEKYALYSEVKDANYQMKTYSNGATAKGTGNAAADDGVQRANVADGKIYYSKADIEKNQLLRQDKWGARMDSVGYAVNGQVANYTGAHAWKKEAAVSLVMALTLDEQAQIDLTYGGAQLPNFISQTEEFLNYNKSGHEDGAFKDMLTPEGFADSATPEAGKAAWDWYYQLVNAMADASKRSATENLTVKQYLDSYDTANCPTGSIRYDTSYDTMLLKNFDGPDNTNRSIVMKILRMSPFTRSDRDLNVRMQYGLNAVRDSSMYTFAGDWMGYLESRNNANPQLLCYYTAKQLSTSAMKANLESRVRTNPAGGALDYITPAVHCFQIAQDANTKLLELVGQEISALQGN